MPKPVFLPARADNSFPELSEQDYYLTADGLMVFTALYHQKRGYCCKNGCRHCPYGYKKPKE